MNNQNSTYVVIAVVAAIIGFGLGAWWKSPSNMPTVYPQLINETSTSTDTTSTSTVSVTTSVSSVANVLVQDQKAGEVVTVNSVAAPQTGWVVITEDASGLPARILGAQKVGPTNTSTTVELLRGTISGNTYHAILYKDSGDGEFDYKVDSPVQGASGSLVESVFKAL